MKQTERIGKLMFRYVRRELTDEEEKELSAWRSLSTENEEFFQRETDPEYIRQRMRAHYESDARMLEKIKREYPEPWGKPTRKKPAKIIPMLKIAASLILGLGALWYVFSLGGFIGGNHSMATIVLANGQRVVLNDYQRGKLAGSQHIDLRKKENGDLLYVAKNRTKEAMNKVDSLYTPEDGHFELRLPEGTHIWMNHSSFIKYPANFTRDHIVLELEGEGYFRITDSAKMQYQIVTDSLVIETNKAELNIRTDSVHSGSSVLVISGTAIIQPHSGIEDSTKQVKLSAGQEARLNHGRIEVNAHPNVLTITAWKKE